MHESNSLDIGVEIFWSKTHKILTVKKLVETTKTVYFTLPHRLQVDSR